MHRASGANTSFRSYNSGGARSVMDKMDDTKLMQEYGGNMMANESRSRVESPQNYGFTSVNMPADKGSDGKIQMGAETFISYMGGNRSFPVTGPVDDRRHRLKGLDAGDSAMFRTKDDYQQFHMHKDGGFWSAAQNKTIRMALIDKDAGEQQQQQQGGQQSGSGAHIATHANGGGGGSGGGGGGNGQGGQQQKKATGQKSVQEDNTKATRFIDMISDKTRMAGKNVHSMLDDGKTYHHIASNKNVYTGGEKDKDKFAIVVTTKGPCKNVWGRIG